MRIGFLFARLLFFVSLGLVLQACLGDRGFTLDENAVSGMKSADNQPLTSTDVKADTLAAQMAEDTNTIYKWDEELYDWVEIGELERLNHVSNKEHPDLDLEAPIHLQWELLMNILYQLKYYSELDLSVFAPVFGRHLERMDGRTVHIEGYVLPVDEEKGLWALSAFPVASCFFCGQASPASVISVYFSESQKRRRYKVGDKLSLSGKLVLNHDDPIELYYVLKDAEVRAIQ